MDKYQDLEDIFYFNPGMVVTLKLDIPNKPKMIVIKKVTSMFKHDPKRMEDKKSALRGIKCMWFTSDGALQEYVFNTKDLTLVKD